MKVNIIIVNVDDNVFVFEMFLVLMKVCEDVVIGIWVVCLNVMDVDGNDLIFYIIGGNVGGVFVI